jgi:hypothetical protein
MSFLPDKNKHLLMILHEGWTHRGSRAFFMLTVFPVKPDA